MSDLKRIVEKVVKGAEKQLNQVVRSAKEVDVKNVEVVLSNLVNRYVNNGEKMSISLQKGGSISLTKESPGIKLALVGLGWNPRITSGADFDLDASAFMLNGSGKCRNDKDFIFYNNKQSDNASVVHSGDDRTGGNSDGDDEVISVDLSKVPTDIEKIVFTVTIHEATSRKQNFGQVEKSYIRIVNGESNAEVLKYNLGEDYSLETAMIFGELYRHENEWKFRAVGQGFNGGLGQMAAAYGLSAN